VIALKVWAPAVPIRMGVGRLALKDVVGPSIQAKLPRCSAARTDGLIERSVEPEACVIRLPDERVCCRLIAAPGRMDGVVDRLVTRLELRAEGRAAGLVSRPLLRRDGADPTVGLVWKRSMAK